MPKETNNKQSKDKKQGKEKKHFWKDFRAELKRVIWPTPKQLLNNTVAVITVVLITAAIVFVLDFVFESLNTYGIDKLKEIVDTTDVNETTNTITENAVTDTNTVENEVNDEISNEITNTATEENNNVEE